MPRLIIATAASAAPMGAQVYEEEVASRATGALARVEPGWTVERRVFRSLRSPLPGDRRLPFGWLSAASPRVRREVGRIVHPRDAVVHRMGLELPPPSRLDVLTLHDVVAWKFPDESAPVRAAAEEARRASAVICVSAFSASEAVDLLGVRDPVVIHNGVDVRFFDAQPATPETLAGLGISGPYVLAAGGASRRKNLDALAEAWPKVHSSRPDLSLVLSGPPHPRRTELFRDIQGVHLVGRVANDTIPGLIAAAAAVVVPSLYEGFGLPALEAMASRTPVVAAATSSLPEVVGDGGILVEPTPEEIAEGVVAATAGSAEIEAMVLRGRERAGGFTWERSVAAHARVWTSVR